MRFTRLMLMLLPFLLFAPLAHGQAPPQSILNPWWVNGKVTCKVPSTSSTTSRSSRQKDRCYQARLERSGREGEAKYDIVGRLENNVFTYQSADKDLTVALVVAGDTMMGSGERKRAGASGKFSLTKKK